MTQVERTDLGNRLVELSNNCRQNGILRYVQQATDNEPQRANGRNMVSNQQAVSREEPTQGDSTMLNSSQQSVLIVDDTPANLHLLSRMLSLRGYKVRAANSGARALAAIRANPPDLILLDIMMPEMNGYEVCEQLKTDEQTRDIPVIFISALDAMEDKIKAFTAGGVDYVTKPFQGKEVLARVKTHLALRRMQKNLEEKNVQLEQEIAERKRAERDLHRHTERLKILHEIDQSILAAQSPGTIALAAIGRIRQLIPCQRAIAMAITRTGQIETLAVDSSGAIKMEANADVYQEMFESQAIRKGWIQGCDDLETLPRRSPMLRTLYAEGVCSYIAVPLFIRGRLVGSLNLEADRPRAFTSDHIAIATEVAVLLAVAIRQAQLHEETQQERQKSDALLLNILPVRVANDLKETGKAAPQNFENVTVCLSDIVGFTDISSQYEPALLISELNELFTAFDNIMEKNQCERIKTVGDAYMAVCGMPEENENHAHNIVQSAIEIIEYLHDRNERSEIKWQVRIGIHSGEVVGGVVGIKKYVYDVFGDAVNTAARMESHSEPMRVNVSESTYSIVKDEFHFTEREAIAVKGKGKMRMYFVDDSQSKNGV